MANYTTVRKWPGLKGIHDEHGNGCDAAELRNGGFGKVKILNGKCKNITPPPKISIFDEASFYFSTESDIYNSIPYFRGNLI